MSSNRWRDDPELWLAEYVICLNILLSVYNRLQIGFHKIPNKQCCLSMLFFFLYFHSNIYAIINRPFPCPPPQLTGPQAHQHRHQRESWQHYTTVSVQHHFIMLSSLHFNQKIRLLWYWYDAACCLLLSSITFHVFAFIRFEWKWRQTTKIKTISCIINEYIRQNKIKNIKNTK